ncbi:MAG: ComEC/Rec2 family competence protein [Flavobacteriaceae bacterium]|nr:ComEC/Rec2 family competence protein [Flavobacteriaceae bacterium]MDZ4146978.1 ComEC/Rec2 family competence protein [Flavobacteriaceae bacterium]
MSASHSTIKYPNEAMASLTLALVAGIFLSDWFVLSLTFLFGLMVGCFLCLVVLYWLSRKFYLENLILIRAFSAFSLVLFMLLGAWVYQIHRPQNQKSHYANFVKHDEPSTLVLEVAEVLKSNAFDKRYVMKVHKIDSTLSFGKLLVSVSKNDTIKPTLGQLFVMRTQLQHPSVARNPFQFDYRDYLKHQNILYQARADAINFLPTGLQKKSIFLSIAQFRENLQQSLQRQNFPPDVYGVMNALLLGQRQEVSEEVNNDYIRAGAIHLLAVSGLHVGVILFLVLGILSPLKRLRHGKWLVLVMSIFSLWVYAVLAGLSPSVVRAVCMFTAITLAIHFRQTTSTINVVFISMLILVLFKPNFVFEVGFQLSYLAVISIIYFNPFLNALWNPRFWVFKKAWDLMTVSTAAQLGVMPLSLYYFHQFPGLFFLSNLFIIPFLGLILGAGFFVLIVSYFGKLPVWIKDLYEILIKSMNSFVAWVAKQEYFLIAGIHFDAWLLMVYAVLILSLLYVVLKRNFRDVFVFGISIFLLQLIYFYKSQKQNLQSEFVVFHQSRKSLLGEVYGNSARFYSDELPAQNPNRVLTDYRVGMNLKKIDMDSLRNVYQFRNQSILLIDQSGIYQIPNFHPDVVVLTQSPKLNLNRLIQTLHPKIIIADGSNYKYLVSLWEKTCASERVRFHSTYENGFFRLR